MQVSKVVDLKPIKMMTIAVQLLCVSDNEDNDNDDGSGPSFLCDICYFNDDDDDDDDDVNDNEYNDDDDGSGPSVLCDIYYLKKIAKVSPISVQRRGHIL